LAKLLPKIFEDAWAAVLAFVPPRAIGRTVFEETA
jgi:hypothetical protein